VTGEYLVPPTQCGRKLQTVLRRREHIVCEIDVDDMFLVRYWSSRADLTVFRVSAKGQFRSIA
jgi:hypothetical protein